MGEFWDLLLHTDEFILTLARRNEWVAFSVVALIIFLECGIIIFSFLPGDGLLLAAGIIASSGSLHILLIIVLLLLAAVSGFFLNYICGRYFFSMISHHTSWIKKSHLDETRVFFQKHGPSALILARFFPIVRSFSPLLAGLIGMPWRRFMTYNVAGAFLWVNLFVLIGYFAGTIPFVQENFFLLYLILVVITLIPFAAGGIRAWLRRIQGGKSDP